RSIRAKPVYSRTKIWSGGRRSRLPVSAPPARARCSSNKWAPTRFISLTLLVEALQAGSPIQNDLVTGTMSVAMRGKGRFLDILTVQPGRSEIEDQLSVAEIFEAGRDFEIAAAHKLNDALQFVLLFPGHANLPVLQRALHLETGLFDCLD